jgi:hypothetical protein
MADIWIATTGNDTTGNGSSGSPYATLQKGVDVASAGDSIIVKNGTYSTTVAGEELCVIFEKTGTAQAPFTLRAENAHGAILDGTGDGETAIRVNSDSAYWTIQGFEITGFAVNGSAAGITVYGTGISNITIRGNKIHTIGKICTDTANGQNGIFVGADTGSTTDVLIEKNEIYDIGRFEPDESGCTPTTTRYQNHDHGIYVAEADDVTIRNNLIYDCARGWCVQRFNTGGHNSVNLLILNNTFGFENPYRDGHIIIATSTTGMRVENNIFYDPRAAGISITGGTHTSGTIKNNLAHAGATVTGSTTGFTVDGNIENTDPLVTDGDATPDFHLTADSPAIGAGLTLSEVTDDFDGVARPDGAAYDIGAFEFEGAGEDPPSPAPDSGWPCRGVGAVRVRAYTPRIRKEYWVEPGSTRTTDPNTDSTHD